MDKNYDSKEDTYKHKNLVYDYIYFFIRKLNLNALKHDNSKLLAGEKEIFDEMTPKLKSCTYGSDEYKSYLSYMQKALKSHYKNNRHHPEHFENGINDMDLFDIVEMFFDWMAATKRHNDGDIFKSIKINKERFKYDDLLESIFNNTAKRFKNSFEIINDNFKFKNENVKKIVYDWWNGVDIYKKYKDDKNLEEANSICLSLISMGFG